MPDYIFGLQYETKLFLLSFLIGLVFGAVYDVLRIVRIVKKHHKCVVFVEDFAFVVFCAFWYFLFSTELARGQIRLFILIGMFIGFIVYLLTLGSLTERLATGIRRVYERIESWIKSKIFTPIYTKLKNKIVQIYLSLRKRIKSRKKGLKVGKNVVYNKDNI